MGDEQSSEGMTVEEAETKFIETFPGTQEVPDDDSSSGDVQKTESDAVVPAGELAADGDAVVDGLPDEER